MKASGEHFELLVLLILVDWRGVMAIGEAFLSPAGRDHSDRVVETTVWQNCSQTYNGWHHTARHIGRCVHGWMVQPVVRVKRYLVLVNLSD
jgi:hypothetical protein